MRYEGCAHFSTSLTRPVRGSFEVPVLPRLVPTVVLPAIGSAALVAGLARALPVAICLVVVGLVATGYGALASGLFARADPRQPPAATSMRLVAAGVGFCGASTLGAGIAGAVAPHALLADVPLPAELPLI